MTAKRPNLIYVFPDEFRQRAMGFRGEDPVITPNLDAFADESFELNNMISNYPVCSPYRAMLFTGKYPHTNGVFANCHSQAAQYGVYLKENDVCISDVLYGQDYALGYVGKWHLDPSDPEQLPYIDGYRGDKRIWDSYTPLHRRHKFDFWYSYGCSDNHMTPHYWKNNAKIEERINVNQWSAEHETDVAISYINNSDGTYRDENKPFALFLAYNPPHMPFNQVPEKYLEYYKDKTSGELLNCPNAEEIPPAFDNVRNYFAAVTGIDDQFGRVLKAIDEKGLKEDTIVIFTSDHGELMGSHGLMGKDYWYRESVNVPFLIRFPKKLVKGSSDEIVNIPDIYPTLLELMGLSECIPEDVEGKSFYKVFSGGETEGYAYYGSEYRHTRGIISREYTYAVYRKSNGMEREYLYHNPADPYQMHNIDKEQPEMLKSMRERLYKMCVELNDPWISKDYPFHRL